MDAKQHGVAVEDKKENKFYYWNRIYFLYRAIFCRKMMEKNVKNKQKYIYLIV